MDIKIPIEGVNAKCSCGCTKFYVYKMGEPYFYCEQCDAEMVAG